MSCTIWMSRCSSHPPPHYCVGKTRCNFSATQLYAHPWPEQPVSSIGQRAKMLVNAPPSRLELSAMMPASGPGPALEACLQHAKPWPA